MVVTRRRARETAEATEAPEVVQVVANTAHDSAASPSASTPSSDKTNLSERSAFDRDDICIQKKHQDSLRRSISTRLAVGHLIATVAVITFSHGAFQPVEQLDFHALILLLCTVPLRTVLSFTAHSVREPLQRSGIFLALSAPVVFASHALHVLATRASPHRIRRLMASAAVDICANWLKMTVSAKTPTTEPFAIPISFIYSASDIFLTAVVAGQQSIVGLFYPFLAIRFLYNTSMVVTCSLAIVRQEEASKKVSNAPR